MTTMHLAPPALARDPLRVTVQSLPPNEPRGFKDAVGSGGRVLPETKMKSIDGGFRFPVHSATICYLALKFFHWKFSLLDRMVPIDIRMFDPKRLVVDTTDKMRREVIGNASQ